MMEFRFEAGELDAFFEKEHGYTLTAAIGKTDVYTGAHAACQVAEWDCLGTDGLSDADRRWRAAAFFSCAIIVEATLRDDAIRRALTAVHSSVVQITESMAGPCYQEAVYRLARVRMIHVECKMDDGKEWRRSRIRSLKDCREMLSVPFRIWNGFHGSDYPRGWIQRVQGELNREADLAAGILEQRAATGQPDSKTDSGEKLGEKFPENPAVYALATFIRKNDVPGETKKSLALQFTDGDDTLASNLLKQLQPSRFGHLLDGTRFAPKAKA